MFRPTSPLTRLVLIVAWVPATATAQTMPFEESARRGVQQLAQTQSQASVPPDADQVQPGASLMGADGRCTEKRASGARGKPILFADLSSSVVSAPSLFGKPTARLNVGDAVSVIDADGSCTEGRVAELTSSSLTLLVDKRERRTFPAANVQRILVRDSLWDGTVEGLALGAAVSASVLAVGAVLAAALIPREQCGLAGNAACSSTPKDGISPGAFIVAVIATSAGIGAAIGAVIDKLSEEMINISISPAQRARFTVSPVIRGDRRAVLVSVRF